MQIYFPLKCEIVKVKIFAVWDFIDEFQRTVLISMVLANQGRICGFYNTLSDARKQFCNAIGDDPTSRTEEQQLAKQQLAIDKPEEFVSSFIYKDPKCHVMQYSPELALDRKTMMVVHPVRTSETFTNDCLVIALNFLLRYPYFTHQKQVLRLSAQNLKLSKDTVQDIKVKQGVKIATFLEEFLIKDGVAYKLKPLLLSW